MYNESTGRAHVDGITSNPHISPIAPPVHGMVDEYLVR